ncbi:hypothetical protein ECB03_22635 [Salmonella enterica subsp. enterica]|nr:hypothetical protein [Salmonella enterica subsp. enterica]
MTGASCTTHFAGKYPGIDGVRMPFLLSLTVSVTRPVIRGFSRSNAQIQRPAPMLRTVTAYRSQAHALTAKG